MSQQPRRIAGRYEVSPLEGGGMGRIWQGYDTVLDRLVAIKQIRSDRHASAAMRRELAERFRREARVMAKIEHPGVPAVYDAAIDRDTNNIEQLYLVMQLVRGVTVADLLAQRGSLPIGWAVAIAAQVCSVLSHAHAIPVIHRDLKPSNIMVDVDGTVKVLDFGVAAVLRTDVTQLTATGQVIGSRDYMSPEQFYGVGVSPRSDLYALGCLLHEMMTGGKVFDGASDPALQHVHEPPPPLRTLRAGIDERLERLVLDLLEKAPDDRPASAREVFDRLAPFLPGPGDPRTRQGTTPASGAPDPTAPYRHPLAPRSPATPAAAAWSRPQAAPTHPDRAHGSASTTGGHPAAGASRRLPPATAEDLDGVLQQAADLVEDERFGQAAGLLDEALALPEVLVAPDDPLVLDLRSTRAAALFLGGDFRRALEDLDALSLDYARVAGPRDERVLECRKQAAYCHLYLGDTEASLAAFQALLEEVRRDNHDRSPEALELRRQIGILLMAARRMDKAVGVLRPLLQDLISNYGPDHPDVHEVNDLLHRIRWTAGTGD